MTPGLRQPHRHLSNSERDQARSPQAPEWHGSRQTHRDLAFQHTVIPCLDRRPEVTGMGPSWQMSLGGGGGWRVAPGGLRISCSAEPAGGRLSVWAVQRLAVAAADPRLQIRGPWGDVHREAGWLCVTGRCSSPAPCLASQQECRAQRCDLGFSEPGACRPLLTCPSPSSWLVHTWQYSPDRMQAP